MPLLRASLLLLTLLGLASTTTAQTALTLPQCLDLAVQNNLQLRQSTNQLQLSEVQLIQQKFAFLPSVNAGLSMGKSFGTFVDNFTQQIAESPYTGSPNLGATLSLFQGMSKWNDLKNAKYSLAAANYSLEDLKNDIRLNVAMAYFQVIFAQDQLKIARERLDVLAQQLEKVQAQQTAGSRTEGDVYAVKAQLASERSNVVMQENTYQKNLLNLIQAMNLDPSEEYTLARPIIDGEQFDQPVPALEEVYTSAVATHPGMRAKAMESLAKKYALSSAKAILYPSVSLSYGLGSFYSSNNRPVLRVEPDGNGGFVPIYGDPKALGTQMRENFGQNLNLGISIPIFSNYNLRSSIIAARVSYENALLNEENEQNELYKAIQQARLDVVSAKTQLDANQDQLENAVAAYTYAEAKHSAGMLDFYTLIEVLNNKTKAEASLNQARYDYIFKQKVLDIYQGKPLNF